MQCTSSSIIPVEQHKYVWVQSHTDTWMLKLFLFTSHIPINLICESEKPCRCAWDASPILKFCALHLLHYRQNLKSQELISAEFWTRDMSSWSVAKHAHYPHFSIELVLNLHDKHGTKTAEWLRFVFFQMQRIFPRLCLKLVIVSLWRWS